MSTYAEEACAANGVLRSIMTKSLSGSSGIPPNKDVLVVVWFDMVVLTPDAPSPPTQFILDNINERMKYYKFEKCK